MGVASAVARLGASKKGWRYATAASIELGPQFVTLKLCANDRLEDINSLKAIIAEIEAFSKTPEGIEWGENYTGDDDHDDEDEDEDDSDESADYYAGLDYDFSGHDETGLGCNHKDVDDDDGDNNDSHFDDDDDEDDDHATHPDPGRKISSNLLRYSKRLGSYTDAGIMLCIAFLRLRRRWGDSLKINIEEPDSIFPHKLAGELQKDLATMETFLELGDNNTLKFNKGFREDLEK
ncbi:hypothetical protein Clacol_004707 [Clathrus columnatus]|uniref:Uncharacterized protein n=1 Tax=Clathrus columnatus TaxID=1419009 RepID=A0AAV5ABS9_9AGAM|nr:hypothetical protein Clacol_004707 [Clathrus columnatus]